MLFFVTEYQVYAKMSVIGQSVWCWVVCEWL